MLATLALVIASTSSINDEFFRWCDKLGHTQVVQNPFIKIKGAPSYWNEVGTDAGFVVREDGSTIEILDLNLIPRLFEKKSVTVQPTDFRAYATEKSKLNRLYKAPTFAWLLHRRGMQKEAVKVLNDCSLCQIEGKTRLELLKLEVIHYALDAAMHRVEDKNSTHAQLATVFEREAKRFTGVYGVEHFEDLAKNFRLVANEARSTPPTDDVGALVWKLRNVRDYWNDAPARELSYLKKSDIPRLLSFAKDDRRTLAHFHPMNGYPGPTYDSREIVSIKFMVQDAIEQIARETFNYGDGDDKFIARAKAWYSGIIDPR